MKATIISLLSLFCFANISVAEDIENISTLRSASQGTETSYSLQSTASVVYVGGDYVFVKDATGQIALYNTAGSASVGDQVTVTKGALWYYSNAANIQLQTPTIAKTASGGDKTLKKVTDISTLTNDDCMTVVKLSNVKFTASGTVSGVSLSNYFYDDAGHAIKKNIMSNCNVGTQATLPTDESKKYDAIVVVTINTFSSSKDASPFQFWALDVREHSDSDDPDQPSGGDEQQDIVNQPAYTLDMRGADAPDTSTLRNITYSKSGSVYTFSGLIEDGADVKFHISNSSNVNNIAFDNGEAKTDGEAEQNSPYTWYLPAPDGTNTILVAVYAHQNYNNARLKTFQTSYSETSGSGYIVVLNESRDSIQRVVKFGIGEYKAEVIQEVANIAEFKAMAQTSKQDLGYNTPAKVYTITGPVTCIVDYIPQNSWYYVQDATGTLGIYIDKSFPLGVDHAYSAGDVLKGITGYSVGSSNNGYQMEVDAERFFVYDPDNRNADKEYTQFPAASGKADVLPPTELTAVSEVTRSMNHDYVMLKGFRFDTSKAIEGSSAYSTYNLTDASGKYFEITWDIVGDPSEENNNTNAFLDAVPDGSTGNFTGFISNNTKNFVISSWEISTGIDEIENGKLKMENSPCYNVLGQRVSANAKGIKIINGKKIF